MSTAGLAVGQPFNPFKLFTGIFIPEPICKCSSVSAGAKLVYGRLCRFGGEDGKAYPSVPTLGRELGISGKQARRYVLELEKASFIRAEREPGKQSHYVFLWHAVFDSVPLPKMGVPEKTPPIDGSTTPPEHGSTTPPIDGRRRESIRESFEDSQFSLVQPEIVTPAKKDGLTPQQEKWFTEFWAAYWRRKAKKTARSAFAKKVKTPAMFQKVMAGIEAQKPEMMAREPDKRPHPATWLNGERWEDEHETLTPKGAGPGRAERRQAAIDSAWEAIANGTE